MAKKRAQLRSRMSPASQARAEANVRVMLAEMPLNELRQARGLSQKMLADVFEARDQLVRVHCELFNRSSTNWSREAHPQIICKRDVNAS